VSYVLAAYGIVLGALVLYAVRLARARAALRNPASQRQSLQPR